VTEVRGEHRPSQRALRGWLTAEAVSLTGTRVSMVAIPWLVLTTSGSATWTGIVAFAEMLPYVLAKAAAGPLIDRLGARRVSVITDLLSVVVVGSVPLLHALDLLTLPVVTGLVALAGLLRGPSDGAKHALVPAVVRSSGVSLERATGLSGAIERLASTLGAAFAGVLVAAVGPAQALVLDALSFGLAAGLLAAFVPAERSADQAPSAGYLADLREGGRFLRREPVLLAITIMVAFTNLLDTAYAAVLVPVWADETGGGAQAIGLLFGSFSAAAVLGSVIASRVGERLPRFRIYVIAFAVCGLPRFAVLAYDVAADVPVWWVLVVSVVGGFGAGFINPILGAVIYERIPEALVGRVITLTSALSWAGMPFGGLVAGLLVSGYGEVAALLAVGAAYTVATMSPLLVPSFRRFDERPAGRTERAAESVSAETGEPERDLTRG
jgi:MFS family permease